MLFVCTGNTCRSPMAAQLARCAVERHRLDGFEIGSSGIHAQEGQPASTGARHAMKVHGLSLQAHRARRLTPELAAQADLILTMTAAHAKVVKRIVSQPKVFSIGEFVDEPGDVADPFGGSDAVYEACAGELERLVSAAIQRLAETEGAGRKAGRP